MATTPLSIFQDAPAPGDRRRSLRHKVHSPAYASFSGLGGGLVLDLSELRDISPEGMSLQEVSVPLEIDRTLNIVLDLSETKTYLNTTGTIIWKDGSGRCGIRFGTMPESSLRQLKSWLMFNTLTALTKSVGPSAVSEDTDSVAAASGKPESSHLVADAPTLNSIRSQAEALRHDLSAALEFLADSARLLTRSSGAAIALGDGNEMVCRASSADAPPVGARFQAGSGFSGECVRTAKLQRCDDTEGHPLVNRESCHALGIRSMIAAPVLTSGKVSGLLEVFSPHPYAFEESDAVALGRLAEIIAQFVPPTIVAEPAAAPDQPAGKAVPRETVVLIAAIVLIVLAIAASVTLVVRGHRPVPSVVTSTVQPEAAPARTTMLENLRRFADTGDPVAQFALGARYAQGDEVKQDYAEAVRWFEKAANQGHVVAQATLGAYYWAGRGIPEDLTKAYFWSVLARAGGDEASKYRVAALTSRMTRLQVTQAQQQADEWLRQHQGTTNSHLQRSSAAR